MIIRNEYDWFVYIKQYAQYQNVPLIPPSYPCLVHSMVLNMGDYEFVGHTFITVEDIEMPGDVDYSNLPEVAELMHVAERMYDHYE
jgi:hypothetical protein